MRRDFAEVLSAKLSGVSIRGTAVTAEDERFFKIPIEDDAIVIPIRLAPTRKDEGALAASVGYRVERANGSHTLMRTLGPLGPEMPGENKLEVAEGVLAMRAEYLPKAPGSEWQTGWTSAELPGAVRVSLTLMDTNRYFEQVSRKAVFAIKVD